MLPTQHPNHLLTRNHLRRWDLKKINIITSKSSRYSLEFNSCRLWFQSMWEKLGKIAIAIWNSITKVNNISFVYKFILERKTMIRLTIFFLHLATLLITNFRPLTDPSNSSLFKSHHWKHGRPHSSLKQRMFFCHIYKIDLNSCTLGHITNTKKKPLIISFGIDIIL